MFIIKNLKNAQKYQEYKDYPQSHVTEINTVHYNFLPEFWKYTHMHYSKAYSMGMISWVLFVFLVYYNK